MYDLFKAYDVRGIYGDEINEDLARRVGKALAKHLENGKVVVGRDMRNGSKKLAAAMIEGLIDQGREVIDIGMVATDMVYFAVGKLGYAGGAMITASHNPPEYNGIKLCASEARAIGIESGLAVVRDLAIANDFTPAKATGNVVKGEITEDWIEHILGFINQDKLKPYRLVVDAGNGMAGSIFAEMEPYLPLQITELYFEPDGSFPNHEANPSKRETLQEAIKLIKSDKLDGGIAFDGDGDRAVLIDENGNIINGGTVTAILAKYFLQKYPGSNIVYSAVTSHSVKDVISENGGRAIVSRVGHSFVKQLMREHDAPFGGESSAHYYFRDNWYADSGLLAMMICLHIASSQNKKLSQLNESFSRYATSDEINFEVKDKEKAMLAIESKYSQQKIYKLDGLTIELVDAWFNVRPSNTEPLLRLNAEAKTTTQLDSIIKEVSLLISA